MPVWVLKCRFWGLKCLFWDLSAGKEKKIKFLGKALRAVLETTVTVTNTSCKMIQRSMFVRVQEEEDRH